MKIGLDFDNTIVCYDQAIEQLAEQFFELPLMVPRTKLGLRDFLRRAGREQEWTAFQGEIYGPGMRYAQPFDGAVATMQKLVAEGHELTIVSHRSRKPYAGRPHDLHNAAQGWIGERLQVVGLFEINSTAVYFMESRDEKIAKISEIHCDAFLDDLPEVLNSPEFPTSTLGIHFSPGSKDFCDEKQACISAWEQLPALLQQMW